MSETFLYPEITDIVFTIKMIFITICTYFTNLKILNSKTKTKKILFLNFLLLILISIICSILKDTFTYFLVMTCLILVLSIMSFIINKNSLGFSIITNSMSLSINYIIFFITVIIDFFPVYVFNIKNDYINLLTMMIIHLFLLKSFFKLKRFKDGITFIKNKINNEYFDVLILNISIIIILATTMLNNLYYTNFTLTENLILSFIIFSIIMFITIQKTLTMYYKHKMLVKDLNETKEELENTKKDRDKLEQENIEISKMSHSISHKQKSIERKLNKLMMNAEIADELDIKERINKISEEYSKNKVVTELSKTEVEVVDDMLECMKDECIENNINFELQVNGNIHYMTNNIVSKEELEILLADHIKDAIIAIQHSDNINRSILVSLGLIDEFYSLYIYDSGIEFEIDTLINLGEKPITTHKDEGGTGMGFLNTFDTLRKHKASMIIDEIGKPSKDNYTKVIMIKFDGNDEFKVKSYRSEEIRERDINNNLQIETK